MKNIMSTYLADRECPIIEPDSGTTMKGIMSTYLADRECSASLFLSRFLLVARILSIVEDADDRQLKHTK